IGGIGPAATDVYYRGLIAKAAAMGRDLELTIVHGDAPTLLANLSKGDVLAQSSVFERLTKRLKIAGAECVVVTSVAGHFCVDQFATVSPLPVIDLTKTLSSWLEDKGMSRIGVLGTQTVMASRLYGKLPKVEIMPPEGSALGEVHEAYVALARSGVSTPALQKVFFDAGQALMERGAEAVMLGGTDLNVAFESADCGFPLVDCAGIHIDAVAQFI
ncbi:MAG: aspartate/glutamate racemase family protein, partial [Pseudomonadota bacterium]